MQRKILGNALQSSYETAFWSVYQIWFFKSYKNSTSFYRGLKCFASCVQGFLELEFFSAKNSSWCQLPLLGVCKKGKKNFFPKNFVISNVMQPGITCSTISKEMVSHKRNREQNAVLFHDLARENKLHWVTWDNLTSWDPWSSYALRFCPSKEIIKERLPGLSERRPYPFQLHLIYELFKLFPKVCLQSL